MGDELKKQDLGPEQNKHLYKDDDTAGHRKFSDDGDEPGPEGTRRMPSVSGDDLPGPEGARRHMTLATGDDDDTEAHKK